VLVSGVTDDIVGREQELQRLSAFIAATDRLPVGCVIRGEAGVGKSTLWRATVRLAEDAGYRVLTCRPAGAEVRLSHSGLADLLEDCLDDVLPSLPPPLRRALGVALLRVEADDGTLDQRAVAMGVLAAIRALAGSEPVLVAIDDAPWLDAPSADAIEYSARRLRTEPVAFLLSARSDSSPRVPLGLERALDEHRLVDIELPPLSLGALHLLLRERTGRTFSRPILRRIFETSAGNPFYALELARAIEDAPPTASEPMPITKGLDELLGHRLDALPSETTEALFISAAAGQPTLGVLDEILGASAAERLEPAVTAGIVRIDDAEIRFTHPLLAAAAYSRGGGHRRRWHARLAEHSTDPEQRARHLALSVEGRDEALAALLMDAGLNARSRGASAAAAELFETAIARTPADDLELMARRTVDAVPTLTLVGDRQKARTLLEAVVTSIDEGPLRARALLLLSELVEDDVDGDVKQILLLDQAFREGGDDPGLQAHVLLQREMIERSADRFPAALELARQALTLAERSADVSLLVHALTRTADLEVLLGLGGEPTDRFARAIGLEATAHIGAGLGPASMLAVCLVRAGRIDEARPLLLQQRQRALDEGDESSHDLLCLFLAELEWLAGNFEIALDFARESHEVAEGSGSRLMIGATSGVLALVEGTRGDLELAIPRAADGARICDEIGEAAYAAYDRQVLGLLELSRGDTKAARHHLAGLTMEHGIEGPKRISFAGDAIEAMIRFDELGEAAELIAELDQRGRLLDRPPLTAIAIRCRALLIAADGRGAVPEAEIAEAIATFEALGLPFERARTLLVLGEVRRRAKQKRPAREALEAALASFDALGAPAWAERTRGELARIGGRSASGDLTSTERRVAELVASGLSNKEVAAILFVSVKAVEANLSRIYAKLGVTSRTELARRI
jgi:DNA-binding CsgD family transcriptional regulator